MLHDELASGFDELSRRFYERKAVPASNEDDRAAIEAVHEEYLRVNGEWCDLRGSNPVSPPETRLAFGEPT